ncbi:MAG: hypothetical protein NW224_12610 [Leptolyngbyaceae cyanobacterium bins.302]|nr:hypothetical protein [Leptolyngbyaceae cyanobacterium bins.302]
MNNIVQEQEFSDLKLRLMMRKGQSLLWSCMEKKGDRNKRLYDVVRPEGRSR